MGHNCRFHPTCSEYAIESIRINGVTLGSIKAFKRIIRCGPWSKGGIDEPTKYNLKPTTNSYGR